MKTLNNKLVLITGAARGLGLATAKAFAREGARVIITDCRPGPLQQAVEELQQAGYSAAGYVMDVTSEHDVRSVRELILDDQGPPDVLVNNAGVVFGGPFLQVPLSQHLKTYTVNTHGPVIVTHVFLKDLLNQPEAQLVNIASASALIGLPHGSTYASSKWAVLGFSESLREELQQSGNTHVTVTAICPSYVNTGMFRGVRTPFLIPMVTPESVARDVVRCVRNGREQLLTPFPVRLLPLTKATWPRAAYRWLLSKLGTYRSMQTWQGHGDAASGEASGREVADVH